MRKLAARLDVQVSTLYYHMPSKAIILSEVLVAAYSPDPQDERQSAPHGEQREHALA